MEKLVTIIFAVVLSMQCAQAERINHEGRILRTTPPITNAMLFNTPEADAVVSSLQIFRRKMYGMKTFRADLCSQTMLR